MDWIQIKFRPNAKKAAQYYYTVKTLPNRIWFRNHIFANSLCIFLSISLFLWILGKFTVWSQTLVEFGFSFVSLFFNWQRNTFAGCLVVNFLLNYNFIAEYVQHNLHNFIKKVQMVCRFRTNKQNEKHREREREKQKWKKKMEIARAHTQIVTEIS